MGGKFVKGQSGNPSGRHKVDPELTKICKKLTPMLIERLEYWAQQKSDPPTAVKAIGMLLDRGHGKAVESIEVSGKDGTPLVAVIRNG